MKHYLVLFLTFFFAGLSQAQSPYSFDETVVARPGFLPEYEGSIPDGHYSNSFLNNGSWSNEFTVPGIVGRIYSTATDGMNLFIGGNFQAASGTLANNIVKWDGYEWHSLGEGPENGITSPGSNVHAMTYADGKLYVGGIFSRAGTLDVNGLAFWDGDQWNSIGTGESNGVRAYRIVEDDTTLGHGFVYSLFVHGNKLYVGGDFHLAGDIPSNGVAVWNLETQQWEPMQGGLDSIYENDPV